ncbi:citrate lyase subunit beta [Salmonella enterica subsp. enterica]|uniref:Citrate lyase subunit beta n=1 Tax=Salmonella enterica I TaxID=59201 RepID=A0A447MWB8_SALET|nr:citrate lyase subunit beta [Salmonella enterica subsp. enterica]
MISASLQQRKTRTRRSMLFVPGANAAMVSNSFIYPADALMFDLEDSVALREKDAARRLVYHALQHPLYRDVETIVRVNALDSEWGVQRSGSGRARRRGRGAFTENRHRAGRH